MKFFRGISQLMVLTAVGLLIYDLIYQWVVNARLKVSTVEEMWGGCCKGSFKTGQNIFQAFFPNRYWDSFTHWPAPLAFVALAVFFYVIYRFLLLVSGGGKSSQL